MAKKVSKGYLILDESCKLCDMPLMEGRGRKECRVCPAIMKWMRKHENDGEEEKYECLSAEEGTAGGEGRDRTAHEEVMSDATPDIKSFMTADIRNRILDLTPIPEKLEFSNDCAVINVEQKPKSTKGGSKKDKKESKTPKSEEKQAKTEAKSMVAEEGVETDGNRLNASISVEDRARQIIKEVRNREGRDDTVYPQISSPIGSQEDEVAYYQEVAEARAELIIKKARASLHKDGEICSEVEQKSDVVTPALIVKRAKESLQNIEEGPSERSKSFVKKSKESLQKVRGTKNILPPLTPMSKLRKKQSNWLDYTASPLKMTSWDAARIIQSFARMVLSRKIFLEYLSDKRTKMYQDKVTGEWKPKKADLIFESRSNENEEHCEGDPDGEVRQTSSRVVESSESMHVDNRAEQRMTVLRVAIDPVSEEEEAVARNIYGNDRNVQLESRTNELRISIDPSSDNQVEVSHIVHGSDNRWNYTLANDSNHFLTEDVSTVGDIYTSTHAPRHFNYEAQHECAPHSKMFDLNQLQIEHEIIDETSTLPSSQIVYGAEVINASDLVHHPTPTMSAGDRHMPVMMARNKNQPVIQDHALNATSAANYAGMAVRKNDPPAVGVGIGDGNWQKSQTMKRSLFAKVACSFDDAVSKVVSNMTACSGSGEVIGLKSQYKSAPVSSPLADGTYFGESKRHAASYSIMYRTSIGWTIVNQACPECQMPMMKRPDDQKILCVACDESDLSDNATLGTMLRSEAPRQESIAVVSQMRSVAGNQNETFDRLPTSIGTRSMTNVDVPKQRAPIDPEPEDAASAHTNRSKKKVQPKHSTLSPAKGRVTMEPPPYVNALPQQPNDHAHQRQMSTSSNYSRSAGTYSFVSHQWKITKQSCPRCSTHMMMNAYDNSNHCHSCGTVLSGPAPSKARHSTSDETAASFLDSIHIVDDNAGKENPFVLAHRQMITSPRSMPVPIQGARPMPRQQPIYQMPQVQQSHAPQRIYSFSHVHDSAKPLQQRAQNQTLRIHTVDHPTPNTMTIHHFNDPTPNHNRMTRSQPQHYHSHVGVKENSYGDANMRKQHMSSVDETKLQILENAQNAMRRNVLYHN